jgi:hypothetical protein
MVTPLVGSDLGPEMDPFSIFGKKDLELLQNFIMFV